MSSHHLPANPNLTNLRNRAKQLLKAHQTGDAETWARWRLLPQFEKLTDSELQSAPIILADAQSVIAREYGFDSWRHLKHHIETPDALKALDRAIAALDAAQVRHILQRSPELAQARFYSPEGEDGETVLCAAVKTWRKGESGVANRKVTPAQIALVEAILDAGADINEWSATQPGPGLTPLAAASWLGMTGFVELLLARGADPNAEEVWINDSGKEAVNTALGVAADHNHTAIVERLIKAGARFHAGQLAQAGLIDRLTTWLDQHSDQVNQPVDLGHLDGDSGSLLHSALDPGRFSDPSDYESVVQLLLSRGIDANAADSQGRTALDMALTLDTPMGKRVVKLLLEHGAEGEESN